MTWLRIDDGIGDHRKIRRATKRAGVTAFGLHVLGLAHCAKYTTDGLVDHEALEDIAHIHNLAEVEQVVAALVAAGLWIEVNDGWQIHDFLDHNPSRAELAERDELAQARRSKDAARKRNNRASRNRPRGQTSDTPPASARTNRGSSTDSPNGQVADASRGRPRAQAHASARAWAHPVPSRPLQLIESSTATQPLRAAVNVGHLRAVR